MLLNFSMLPLRLARRASFLQLFKSFFQPPHSPQPLFRNSLISYFYSLNFKNVQMFHQNSTFVAETHVYAKPLTQNRRLLPGLSKGAMKT